MSDKTDQPWQPHERPGFIVWRGGHRDLVEFLAQHPDRRVQDPGTAAAVTATAGLDPKLIVDYCAGRGTKTKQLTALHPAARIVATDVDPQRLTELKRVFAEEERVVVTRSEKVADAFPGHRVDLLVLDVPCSNTGALARRPEARYRFSERSMGSLVELQRQIMRTALPLVAAGGHVVYLTESVEPTENEQQRMWTVANYAMRLLKEATVWPQRTAQSYQDGGYYAMMQRTDYTASP